MWASFFFFFVLFDLGVLTDEKWVFDAGEGSQNSITTNPSPSRVWQRLHLLPTSKTLQNRTMHIPENAGTYWPPTTCWRRTEAFHWEAMGVGFQRDPSQQVEAHWLWLLNWAAALKPVPVVQVRIRIRAQLRCHRGLFRPIIQWEIPQLGGHIPWLICKNVPLLLQLWMLLVFLLRNQICNTNLSFPPIFLPTSSRVCLHGVVGKWFYLSNLHWKCKVELWNLMFFCTYFLTSKKAQIAVHGYCYMNVSEDPSLRGTLIEDCGEFLTNRTQTKIDLWRLMDNG